MIPAMALMSTFRLHLSVVRRDFAAAKLRFFEQMVQNNMINMDFLLVGRGLHRLPNFCRPCGTDSILDLILFRFPSAEGANGFVAEQRDGRHGARFLMLLQLLVNEIIGEVDGGGILFRVAIVDALDMRPIDGTEAHRTRLARGVDDTIREVESAEFAASLTDGVHLGMGGGVVVASDAVGTASDDFSIFHNDGPEGTTPVFHAFVGQSDGLAHESFILFRDIHSFFHFPTAKIALLQTKSLSLSRLTL